MSDSTANTTFVMFGPAEMKDITFTCQKKKTKLGFRENEEHNQHIRVRGCQIEA